MRIMYYNITYRCNSNCMFCAADYPLTHSQREMTLEEFDRELKAQCVGVDDRVIINGGEPTIHKDFLLFLDAVSRRGATIDLFTNGIRLQDKSFAEKIVARDRIHIRIPLFGAAANTHDRLTGHGGNFDATIRGIDNICPFLSEGVSLEIKMLLSKATVIENERIYDLICTRWHNINIKVSLNPLLISDSVIRHKEMFIMPYDELVRSSEVLIRRIVADQQKFSIDLIPYCAFPDEELIALRRGNRQIDKQYYTDPDTSIILQNARKKGKCRQCKYVSVCNGFSSGYIRYFGEAAIKPYSVPEAE